MVLGSGESQLLCCLPMGKDLWSQWAVWYQGRWLRPDAMWQLEVVQQLLPMSARDGEWSSRMVAERWGTKALCPGGLLIAR